MVKTHLAPGFRFHPTDVELVKYYLKRKVMGKKLLVEAIAEIDIYKFEPSDLPDKSCLRTGDLKWYFFCPRERKYGNGVRMNRATEYGYWKMTGKDRAVLCNNEVVGKIKTLVYHCGKSPRGERTDWVMHEYRLEDKGLAQKDVVQDSYVLCVLFKKDGPGPRNGAQYGAPFKEEEWSDGEENTENVAALPSTESPIYLPGMNRETSLVATTSQAPKDFCGGRVSESCVSDVIATANMSLPLNYADNTPLLDPNSIPTLEEATQIPGDDIYSMLDYFVDDESFGFGGYSQNEAGHEEPGVCRDGELPLCSAADDIFSGQPAPRDLAPGYNENTPFFLELEDLTEPLTFPGNTDSIHLIQDRFGFSADDPSSCFVPTQPQPQLQPSQPLSGDLKEL
ncbi:PREDICTED: NAC domain-containing protein 82-like [Tarenaya hassleriana]|uniref:NAC domain-containing protein 82-like n=1 Tax=Tarenaya hassleriana TaxID=28532 RepID=UPI00053C2596|nr:PREDICTED: NAC domain-containing protein 82-like [Tarenaya hassleriana]XP_010521060.1 PREDICTED: NAC domain-containing protein 82-like [Tarenaya hassleriana]